jgi:orotidine-5'-phosphate decarboxylase
MSKSKPLIYVALDTPSMQAAIDLADQLNGLPIGLKTGLEFMNANGPQGIAAIQEAFPDTSLFVDLKYHDIPNTVAGAVRSLTSVCRPDYLNVHAAGGMEMMRAARDACPENIKLLAVTILTSLDDIALHAIGFVKKSHELVPDMAALSRKAGLDGVVCSAHEIETVRETCGDEFVLMVPGIRPAGSDHGDQKRTATPADALQAGATHIVIGRAINKADDPRAAAEDILATI